MFPSNTSASYNPSSSGLHEAVSAWFLGPQAENAGLLKELFGTIVDSHAKARVSYHPEDGVRNCILCYYPRTNVLATIGIHHPRNQANASVQPRGRESSPGIQQAFKHAQRQVHSFLLAQIRGAYVIREQPTLHIGVACCDAVQSEQRRLRSESDYDAAGA